MITKENLDKVERHAKAGYLLTVKTLKDFGFHIGEIAYLIETGKLIDRKDGSYRYFTQEKEDFCDFEKIPSKDQAVEPLLSILLEEKRRIDIDTGDSDWDLLEEKTKILEARKGIIVLNAMSEERQRKICQYAKAIPCIIASSIDQGPGKKSVILKFHINEQIDANRIMKAGDKAYHKKAFRQCIKYYLEAFSHFRKPSPYLYGRLGLSYMNIGQTRKAAEFLTVADSLYKIAGKHCRFSDLIEDLNRKNKKNGDRKFPVPFEESDFQNNMNEYYGLKAIEEMAAFVSSGKTIEEVQEKFALTEEQTTLLMLVFARICYTNGDFTLGDRYLRKVEKRKNKTKQIKQLLEEIRRKKKFYKNQVPEDAKSFILTR